MNEEPSVDPSPRSWLRLIESEDADPLDVLRTVGTYQRYLAAIEEQAVATARQIGRSWEEIADAIGVKRQSAWAKYRPTKLLASADVVFAGRRIRPTSIRLKCSKCGDDKVLNLKRSDDDVVAVESGADVEFPLPGNVQWTCTSCGEKYDRRVELPPFFDAA